MYKRDCIHIPSSVFFVFLTRIVSLRIITVFCFFCLLLFFLFRENTKVGINILQKYECKKKYRRKRDTQKGYQTQHNIEVVSFVLSSFEIFFTKKFLKQHFFLVSWFCKKPRNLTPILVLRVNHIYHPKPQALHPKP